MKILKLFKPQDLFTFANAGFGIVSIIFSIRKNFTLAAIFLLVAVLMDFLDGKVARLFNKPHPFGKELDSLADVIAFGAASAIFGFSFLEASSANNAFTITVFVFFVLCGIARLARFNITKVKGYEGMPITINGVIVPVIYSAGLPISYYPYVYLLSGILMISAVKIKKII